jgi:hypothetical protein
MPRAGLQPGTTVFLQAKIGHASDRAVPVIYSPLSTTLIIINLRLSLTKFVHLSQCKILRNIQVRCSCLGFEGIWIIFPTFSPFKMHNSQSYAHRMPIPWSVKEHFLNNVKSSIFNFQNNYRSVNATNLLLLFRFYCHNMFRSYDHHQAAYSSILS